jgi:hypothetical protein
MERRVSIYCILREMKKYLKEHPRFAECKTRPQWEAKRLALLSYFEPPDGCCCPGWIPSYVLPAKYDVKSRARRAKRKR